MTQELSSIGIKAKLIGQVISEIPTRTIIASDTIGSGVLIYLPTTRKQFYGHEIMERVIAENPDTYFIVLADEDHSLSQYPNVSSMGWVNDMRTIWPRVGMLLRITKHDGFSRTIVEALTRGMHVIHNNHLPGCTYACDADTINTAVRAFTVNPTRNDAGPKAIENVLDGENDQILRDSILSTKATLRNRMAAISNIFFFQTATFAKKIIRSR